MKISTKKIVTGGVLLALMIASQFLKGISVYITGPIVNTILIIATLSLGLVMGIILSVIAPVTSFFITGSPLIAMVPLIMPAIMIGNIILCVGTHVFYRNFNFKWRLPVGLITGSVCKAVFMGAVIIKCLIPNSKKLMLMDTATVFIQAASKTFGITQLITALIGSALAFVIWILAGKALKTE